MSVFFNNSANWDHVSHSGGAILIYRGVAIFSACYFVQNFARDKGGALTTTKYRTVIFHSCNFTGNRIKGHISHEYNTIIVAETGGGAIHIENIKNINISNSFFGDNKAFRDGGAIQLQCWKYKQRILLL